MIAPWTGRFLIPLLGLSAGLGLVGLAAVRKSIANKPFIVTVLAGSFPVLIGFINGNPGWLDVGVALVAGPATWYLVAHSTGRRFLDWLPMVIAAAVIVAAAVVVGHVVGFELPIVSALDPNPGSTRTSTEIRVRSASAQSMLGAVPFLIALAYFGHRSLRPHERFLAMVAVLAGIAMILVSGRQAGVAVLALTAVMIPAMRFIAPGDSVPKISVGSCILGLYVSLAGLLTAAMIGVNLRRIPTALLTAIGFTENAAEQRILASRARRSEQQEVLLESFAESPFWGKGAGLPIEGVVRSAEYPWRYEMQYWLLLHEGGLIAAGLYAVAVVTHLRVVKSVLRQTTDPRQAAILRASLIGAAALLAANASNPYLRAVGLQWCIFLPLIVATTIHRFSRTVSS